MPGGLIAGGGLGLEGAAGAPQPGPLRPGDGRDDVARADLCEQVRGLAAAGLVAAERGQRADRARYRDRGGGREDSPAGLKRDREVGPAAAGAARGLGHRQPGQAESGQLRPEGQLADRSGVADLLVGSAGGPVPLKQLGDRVG